MPAMDGGAHSADNADCAVLVNVGSAPREHTPFHNQRDTIADPSCRHCKQALDVCECIRGQTEALQRTMQRTVTNTVTTAVAAKLDTKALRDISALATQTAAVVAVLVATISYTSLLSPPGGWTTLDQKPDTRTTGLEWAKEHDVSAVAAATGDSSDWMPFVGFSVCNFLSLLTSIFSLLLLLSLHLMQYSTVFHAHKIDDPKEQEHRDLLTFSLVSAALGTLIFSILCLLLAAHFAVLISFCRYQSALAWHVVIPIGSLGTLAIFLSLLLFCTKVLLARVFSRYRSDFRSGVTNLRTNLHGGKATAPRHSA